MKNNKNIDQLFRDKLENIDEFPSDKVWENIENQLKEDKKRRIIPFWWKLSGIAAIFIAGIFISNKLDFVSSMNNNEYYKNEVVNKNKTNKNTKSIIIEETISDKNLKNHNQVVSNDSDSKVIQNNYKVVNQNKQSRAETSFNHQNIIQKNNQKAASLFAKNKNKSNKNKRYDSLVKNEKTNEIANFSKSENLTNKETDPNNVDLIIPIDKKISETENIATLSKKEELQTNKLNEILEEKTKDKIKKTASKINKWQVSSNVAPIYFGSTSNNSPVDSKFDDNTKNYENSLSYGVGINYNLTKKITIRAGINKLNLSYQTNDVAFLENTRTIESLVAVSAENNIQFVGTSATTNSVDTFTLASNEVNTGNIKQDFGYFEIPLEFSYAVIDKKLKVNIITGLSTLFLTNNNVSISSQKYNLNFGEANNINKINFSSNIGLGLNHEIFKSFFINFETIFKYQLNTFNNNSNNFNPYIIGFYSGVSYKF